MALKILIFFHWYSLFLFFNGGSFRDSLTAILSGCFDIKCSDSFDLINGAGIFVFFTILNIGVNDSGCFKLFRSSIALNCCSVASNSSKNWFQSGIAYVNLSVSSFTLFVEYSNRLKKLSDAAACVMLWKIVSLFFVKFST